MQLQLWPVCLHYTYLSYYSAYYCSVSTVVQHSYLNSYHPVLTHHLLLSNFIVGYLLARARTQVKEYNKDPRDDLSSDLHDASGD